MSGRKQKEEKYQKIATILTWISQIVDALAYVIPLLIFFSQVRTAMSSANFGTVFEVFFFILLFPFVYGIARFIGFITRQVISLIAYICCRSILGDDYEEYKERKTYEEFRDYFDEAEREREQERGAEKEKEESRTSEGDTELMRDLRLFGLSLPFSKAELRKRYIEAVKQAHPDNGGSPEMAKAIKAARDRLQRYAAG